MNEHCDISKRTRHVKMVISDNAHRWKTEKVVGEKLVEVWYKVQGNGLGISKLYSNNNSILSLPYTKSMHCLPNDG